VSADGEYLGGIICPGVEISLNALTERAAKLPQVELTEPERLIGKTTLEAIQSGIVYGFAAQIDGIVERIRDEVGDEMQVIATGGLSGHIVPFCDTVELLDDMLTLVGLHLIYQRNAR
jgi:type III pantothenate kinase